jgi:hypothetical protein
MERIREHGTVETTASSANERINAIRRVVERKQYAKIDGQMADLFTCSLICQVYDALNDVNKIKFSSVPYSKMAHIAFKLTN